MSEQRDLTSTEIRNLMMDTLAYVDGDIDSEGKNFKMYGYQGTQSDLFRLMEGLAIKNGIVDGVIPISSAAWGDMVLCYIHIALPILDIKIFNRYMSSFICF